MRKTKTAAPVFRNAGDRRSINSVPADRLRRCPSTIQQVPPLTSLPGREAAWVVNGMAGCHQSAAFCAMRTGPHSTPRALLCMDRPWLCRVNRLGRRTRSLPADTCVCFLSSLPGIDLTLDDPAHSLRCRRHLNPSAGGPVRRSISMHVASLQIVRAHRVPTKKALAPLEPGRRDR